MPSSMKYFEADSFDVHIKKFTFHQKVGGADKNAPIE